MFQISKMDRRCSRKAMLEEMLLEDGEARLVSWRLHRMDTSRSRMPVQLNSRYQRFLLYSYLVSDQYNHHCINSNRIHIQYIISHHLVGGPGSGKVTYCDNLIQEKKGITHINMMDLLQQYALGNGSYLE